jgi:glycosyltransferase involved in cell wall biosynthesis
VLAAAVAQRRRDRALPSLGLCLADCLDSIRAQTLAAAHVAVDDGSDDPGTQAALDEAERDGFAVIRQPENRGPSATRNRAPAGAGDELRAPGRRGGPAAARRAREMELQIEAAPPEGGFIYPNAQHFGNRDDYVRSPAYNPFFLLVSNSCPATSLYDRRIFEAGFAYDQGLVLGHEDWDPRPAAGRAGGHWRGGRGFDLPRVTERPAVHGAVLPRLGRLRLR